MDRLKKGLIPSALAPAGFHPKKVLDRGRPVPRRFVEPPVHPDGLERLDRPHPNGLDGWIEILSRVLSVRLAGKEQEH